MGFLNPWIYTVGSHAFTEYVQTPFQSNHSVWLTLHDSIIEARSEGCPGQSVEYLASPYIPNAGWSAVPGWDPVTGWGTPLFDRMLNLSLV